MCVWPCVYVHVCVCGHVCMYMYVCVAMCIRTCMCVWPCVYVHVCVCGHVYTYMYVCVAMCIRTCMCVWPCVYLRVTCLAPPLSLPNSLILTLHTQNSNFPVPFSALWQWNLKTELAGQITSYIVLTRQSFVTSQPTNVFLTKFMTTNTMYQTPIEGSKVLTHYVLA